MCGGADGVQEGVEGQPHDEGGAANNQHGSNHKHYYDIPPRYCGTMNRVPASGVMARQSGAESYVGLVAGEHLNLVANNVQRAQPHGEGKDHGVYERHNTRLLEHGNQVAAAARPHGHAGVDGRADQQED